MRVEFTVYGRPAPQGSKAYMGRSKRGKAILVESSRHVAPWRALLAAQARHHVQGVDGFPLEGAVSVSLLFSLDAPKVMPAGRVRPSVTPDVDKLTRAVLDALTGVAYHDDGQVVDLVVRETYTGTPGASLTPGVRVVVEPAPDTVLSPVCQSRLGL